MASHFRKKLVRQLAAAGVIGGAALAHAQAPTQATTKVEKIEVTGSSIKRIEGETALPVTVIAKDQIDKSGVTNTAELLDKITTNNGGGYNASLAMGDSARPGFSGASLRGLGPNNTLVLLNGRRLAVYAFDGGAVNLSAIPLAAIERVEILRDGASAIYGTDAIGGVINFITRKDYTGADLSAGGGWPRANGAGDYKQYSATLGYGDLDKDRFNVFGTFQYQDFAALKSLDREYARTVVRPDLWTVFRYSSNSFPAGVSVPGVGIRSPAAPPYTAQTGLSCLPPASLPRANDCGYDYVSQLDLIPDSERKGFMGRATVQVTNNIQVFGEYLWSENEHIFRSSQTPASEATTFAGDPILLYPTSRHYPTAWLQANFPTLVGQPLNLYYRSIEAGPRANKTTEEQERFVVGVEGNWRDWDYSAAYSQATSKAEDAYIGGWLRESALIAAFAGGEINPFAPNDEAGLNALLGAQFLGSTRVSKSTRKSFDAKASSELMQMANGPLALAVGAEFTKLEYDDVPNAVLNSGDIIGSGGNQLPVHGSRDVDAVFAELNIPFYKGLEAQLAVRYDRYSDFGNTTNPKVALRWQPTQSLLFRAAAGTGFRAPTLADLYAPPQQSNTGGNYNDPYYDSSLPGNPQASRCATQFDGRYCNAQLTVLQGGNPDLNPEKSKQWTVGVLVEPTRDISVGVDYWQIRQRDQVGILNSDFIFQDFLDNFDRNTRTSSSIYAPNVGTVNDPSVGTTVVDAIANNFANQGKLESAGIDLSFRWRIPAGGLGIFRLGYDATYMDKAKLSLPGAETTETVGTFANFGAVIRYKSLTSLQWDFQAFSSLLIYNFSKGYVDENAANVLDTARRVANYETWDVSTTWSGVENLKLTVGVKNLFDRDPPASNQNAYFQIGYDPTYTDPRGRTLFANVGYSFR